MCDPAKSARGRRVSVSLLAVVALGLCGALLAPSALATSFTWSGQHAGIAESDAHWSASENWEGGTAPSGGSSIETLTFPRLTNGACTSEPPSDTCYATLNDLSGLSVESIRLDDAENYVLVGEGITLGSGGFTASPGASQVAGTFLAMPIALGASQNWSIGSGGGTLEENGVAIEEPITGPGKSLTVELSKDPGLLLGSSIEVGSLTFSGANPSQAGIFNGVVDLFGANLNASNGQPVALNHIFALGAGAFGALSANAGELIVGSALYPSKGIEAKSVLLDSASRLGFRISGTGASAQNDYSQLTSTGAVETRRSYVRSRRGPAEERPALSDAVCRADVHIHLDHGDALGLVRQRP